MKHKRERFTWLTVAGPMVHHGAEVRGEEPEVTYDISTAKKQRETNAVS